MRRFGSDRHSQRRARVAGGTRSSLRIDRPSGARMCTCTMESMVDPWCEPESAVPAKGCLVCRTTSCSDRAARRSEGILKTSRLRTPTTRSPGTRVPGVPHVYPVTKKNFKKTCHVVHARYPRAVLAGTGRSSSTDGASHGAPAQTCCCCCCRGRRITQRTQPDPLLLLPLPLPTLTREGPEPGYAVRASERPRAAPRRAHPASVEHSLRHALALPRRAQWYARGTVASAAAPAATPDCTAPQALDRVLGLPPPSDARVACDVRAWGRR